MVRKIFISAFIVGSFDLACAVVQALLNHRSPEIMLRFIASGISGKEAFAGGDRYVVYGVLLHYHIAIIWTLLFFLLYTRTGIRKMNRIVLAFCYSLCIWVIMTFVVLPISATPSIRFDIAEAMISLLILFVAIGLPLVHLAHYFFRRDNQL